MASTQYTSVDLCAIRVTQLTEGGAPVTGASSGYVTESAISLGISITTEDGDSLVQKNGCGDICATLNEPDKIKGIELSAEFCQLDAYLLKLLTGAELFTEGLNAIGFQFAAVGSTPAPICFEGWSKAWDGDHQAVVPATSPDAAYIHWVFPYTRWVQGDLTLEHDLMVVPATAKGAENPSIGDTGPYGDWPTAVETAGGVTRLGGWFFDGDIPSGTGAYVTVPTPTP